MTDQRRSLAHVAGATVLCAFVLGLPSHARAVTSTTTTAQVSTGDDDYKETSGGLSQRGDTQHDLWVVNDQKQAYRFDGLNVPAGAHIVSAVLKVYATTNLTAAINGFAVGEASGDSHAWTGATNEITNTPKTVATVAISGLPSWTNNTFNDLVDVAPILQEIVVREDYEYDNAVTIFLIANSTAVSRRIKTYNANSSQAAKLEVTWDAPGCPAVSSTCPETIRLAPHDALRNFDTGWSGAGHDLSSFPVEAALTMRVESCAGAGPCGVCQVSGPVPNTSSIDIQSGRCSNNTAVGCADDNPCFRQCVGGSNDGAACTAPSQCPSGGACQGAGICQTYFGSYLPQKIGGSSVCITTYVQDTVSSHDITGTINVDTGASSITIPVTTRIGTANIACASCGNDPIRNDGVRDGTCSGGLRSGKACDANGRGYPSLDETSLDCPNADADLGQASTSPLVVQTSTTLTHVIGASSPACRETGFTGLRCHCDSCNNSAGSPCATNADCVAVGATVCGGKRCVAGSNNGAPCTVPSQCPGGGCGAAGAPTRPNACTDDSATPDLDCASGICVVGPGANYCGPSAGWQSCLFDSDCSAFKTCSGGTRTGEKCGAASDCPPSSSACVADTCVLQHLACYDNGENGDTVSATPSLSTLGTYDWDATIPGLGCAPASNVQVADIFLGLPGLTRIELPARITGTPPPAQDLVFANFDAPNRVCQNDGTGSFTCSNVDGTTYASNGVAVGDLDNDGDSDLAFANNGISNSACLNDGTGSFTCGTVDSAGYSHGVAIGNFDGDGVLDLVFARASGATNRICLGTGGGSYSCGDVSATTGDSYEVAAGDFNGDNKLDVVFARAGARNRICLGNGAGGFTCSDVSTDNLDSVAIAAGDVNGDGDLDVVFGNQGNRNRVCLGNGAGAFTCSDVSTDTLLSFGVAILKLDEDPFLDLVFATYSSQKDRKCFGNGTGAFTCSDASADNLSAKHVVAGDFNHDCAPDVVFANANPGGSEKSRLCLGNGHGTLTCQDVSADVKESRGVAIGDF